MISLKCQKKSFPLAHEFRIARGSRKEAQVVECQMMAFDNIGLGEATPYKHYGEDIDEIINIINAQQIWLAKPPKNEQSPIHNIHEKRLLLQDILPAGAARNALDCALWDLEIKLSQQSASTYLQCDDIKYLHSWVSIAIDTPKNMAISAMHHQQQAIKNNLPLRLKIKLGADDGHDMERLTTIYNAVGDGQYIIDANEGWDIDETNQIMPLLQQCHVALLEQPIKASQSEKLADIDHLVPICADEAFHTINDLAKLRPYYDVINIKLDKTGGLTQALDIITQARQYDYHIMVGCMMGSSLAMAPAYYIAKNADFIDCDGPIWMAQDRDHGLMPNPPFLQQPTPLLWG